MALYTYFGRSFEFFVGIQLALFVRKGGLERTNKIRFTYIGFIMIFVCVGIMSRLAIPPGWSAGLHNPFGIVTNNYLLPICIAMFFYGLITESSHLKKIL